MTNVVNITTSNGAAVATNGTIDFLYPAGFTAAAQFSPGGEVLNIPALQFTAAQAASTFTASYAADRCTITYKGSTTIPAGSKVTLQITPVTSFRNAIVVLTDNSGGTASATLAAVPGSYTQATLANQIASLAAKINEIAGKVNQIGVEMDIDD